jgi:hypothetical protein
MKDERKIAQYNYQRYTRARDAGHLDYVDIARKCDAFYTGEQWEKKDIDKLNAQGKPALTINTILTTVNTVLGEQARSRGEISFKPRRGATQETADTLTKLAMQIGDNNKLDWVESSIFADGLIQDRGYYDIRIDFDDHIEGEIKIKSLDPLDVVLDPDAKEYDPATWNEVFTTRWLSLDEVEMTYGKKAAKDLRNVVASRSEFGEDTIVFEDRNFGQPNDFDTYVDEEANRSIRMVRIIERQHRKIHMAWHFINPETGDTRQVPEGKDMKRIKYFAEVNGLMLKKKPIRQIRWTVSADNVVLHDDWSPYESFTVIPFFPYFRRGKPFGMVRNLISPQEQLNKVSSQELHVVNSAANSGWVVERGSLANMTVGELETRGAETGLVIEVNKGSQEPTKIQANQIPSGLDRISAKAANNIKEISGISDAMLGQSPAEVSGVALEAKTQRGSVQIQTLIDNLARTRHFLAENMLQLIQRFYNEHRVIQITRGNMAHPEQQGEAISINAPDPATGEIINNLTIGEYDVVISNQPARDTFDESQFAEALNLRTVGVMIPDDAIIEYSHLSQKSNLAERIRKMNGQGTPTEEERAVQEQAEAMEARLLELEMAETEGKIAQINAQAALTNAKVRDIETDGDDLELEIHKLEQTLMNAREERANKLKLAKLHTDANIQKASTDAGTRLTLAAVNGSSKSG